MVPLCEWGHCPVQAALADPLGSLALSARLEAQTEGPPSWAKEDPSGWPGLNPPTLRSGKTQVEGHSQFSSVAQSCPTLCDPLNRSMPGPAVHHQLSDFTQTHVH